MKFTCMKVRDLQSVLRDLGCEVVGMEGSHQKWRTLGGKIFTIVANHRNDPVSRCVVTSVAQALETEGIDLRKAAAAA